MIVKTGERIYESSGEDVGVVLKAENIPIVMDCLIHRMYVDKYASTVRELICNGLDAGASQVEVSIVPVGKACVVKVKDDGKGMSLQKIKDVYCSFADSDKRDSDGFIGGFGIGSKSPLSVAEVFSVTTSTGTERTVFSVAINSDKMPVVSIISHEKGDFPSGTEVEFACIDHYSLRTPSIRSEKVFIDGAQAWFPLDRLTSKVALCHDSDRFRKFTGKGSAGLYVVYGDAVVYEPTPRWKEKFRSLRAELGLSETKKFVAFADVSEISPVPSREFIEESIRTDAFFDKVFKELRDCERQAAKQIETYPHPEILLTIVLTVDRDHTCLSQVSNVELPFLSKGAFSASWIKRKIVERFKRQCNVDLSDLPVSFFRHRLGFLFPIQDYEIAVGDGWFERPTMELCGPKSKFPPVLNKVNEVLCKLDKPGWKPGKAMTANKTSRSENSFTAYLPEKPESPTWLTYGDVERFPSWKKAVFVPDFYARKTTYLYAFSHVWETFDLYVEQTVVPCFVVGKSVFKRLPEDKKIEYDALWDAYPKKKALFKILRRLSTPFDSVPFYHILKLCLSQFDVSYLSDFHPALARDLKLTKKDEKVGSLCRKVQAALECSAQYNLPYKTFCFDAVFDDLKITTEDFEYDAEFFASFYRAFFTGKEIKSEDLDKLKPLFKTYLS
jgi:hypothetical protein